MRTGGGGGGGGGGGYPTDKNDNDIYAHFPKLNALHKQNNGMGNDISISGAHGNIYSLMYMVSLHPHRYM